MTSPESGKTPQWNSEVAVPLFQEFARMQIDSGIFAGYIRCMQEYMASADAEDAELSRGTIYMELPLGVEVEREQDDPSDTGLKLYLTKVNPMDGISHVDSTVFTGYSADEETGRVYVTFDGDREQIFTEEQAALLYEQYRIQEQSGLRIGPTA